MAMKMLILVKLIRNKKTSEKTKKREKSRKVEKALAKQIYRYLFILSHIAGKYWSV